MYAFINQEGCIGCGVCEATCPDVFRITDEGPAEVYVDGIPPEFEKSAKDACDSCPVSVITIE